jgi:hypothetical protein
MGGWVCRSEHIIVYAGRKDSVGRYLATVTFRVDPRTYEERNTDDQINARKEAARKLAKRRAIKASYRKQKRGKA